MTENLNLSLGEDEDDVEMDDELDFIEDEYDEHANANDKKTINDLMHRKHVETLKFLRETLKENRELRNRIDLIQTELKESMVNEQRAETRTFEERPVQHSENGGRISKIFIERFDAEIQTDEVVDESVEQNKFNEKRMGYPEAGV